jgi:hypothetical protein
MNAITKQGLKKAGPDLADSSKTPLAEQAILLAVLCGQRSACKRGPF